MTDIMHEADFPHPTNGKHMRTLPTGPAYDATPQVQCSHFGEYACFGLCPRHNPAVWAEHMARHATDSL